MHEDVRLSGPTWRDWEELDCKAGPYVDVMEQLIRSLHLRLQADGDADGVLIAALDYLCVIIDHAILPGPAKDLHGQARRLRSALHDLAQVAGSSNSAEIEEVADRLVADYPAQT